MKTMYVYDTMPNGESIRVVFGGYDKMIAREDPRIIRHYEEVEGIFSGKVYTSHHISEFADYVAESPPLEV